MLAAGDGLQDEEEQDGAERGDEDRADVEVVHALPSDEMHQRATDHRAEDADRDRVETPLPVVLDDPACEQTGEEADEDPGRMLTRS